MIETLGIMVNSHRSGDNLIALTRAARERGKAVRIHLTGEAVRLLADTAVVLCAQGALVSACRQSLESCASPAPISCPAGIHLVAPDKWAKTLGRCDRWIIL